MAVSDNRNNQGSKRALNGDGAGGRGQSRAYPRANDRRNRRGEKKKKAVRN